MKISKQYKKIETEVPFLNLEINMGDSHLLQNALAYLHFHKNMEGAPPSYINVLNDLSLALYNIHHRR